MRYLVTGERGFLLSSVINELDGEVISYEYGESYPNIDIVIHFASPNDRYEFQDKVNMAHTMVDYSLAVVEEARKNGAKFIFASSKAAGICADEYGVYKRFLEQYIEANIYDHLIYRIPSVYGSAREKGLMRQLREDNLDDPSDYDKEVEYLDIMDFREWFLENIYNHGIVEYKGEYRINTIQEVKNLYLKGV